MIKILHVLSTLSSSGGVQNRLLDNYRYINKDNLRFDFIVHGTDTGELESVFSEMGSVIYHVPNKKDSVIKNIIAINRIIKQGDYDIVQSHMEHAGVIPLLSAKVHGVKVRISHSHLAHIDGNFTKRIIFLICSLVIDWISTDFWACSQEAGKWLFGKKIVENNSFIVIPNAIDVKKYVYSDAKYKTIRSKMNWGDKFIVGNVGRLSYQKNHKFLIDIFIEILKINPNAHLVLVGEGEQRLQLEKIIEQKGIKDKVEFLGERKDVPELLVAMDIMIHPALFEGLGNVLVESQAAGLPCIASAKVIPAETRITDIIKYINLNESPEIWARSILEFSNYKRKDLSLQVKDAGYDVVVQGKKLERLYSKLSKGVL